MTACELCHRGHFSLHGGPCIGCSAGKFSALEGSSFCTLCTAGKYASDTGSTSELSCLQCDKGTFSTAGAKRCLGCSAGTFADTKGSTQCTPCPAGSYAQATFASECDLCGMGSYSQANSTECEHCAAGTFAENYGSDKCTLCPTGKYSEKFWAVCWDCDAGYGTAMGSAPCEKCPRGTSPSTQPSATIACEPCTAGKYTNAPGSRMCATCSILGTYAKDARSCEPCPLGTYADHPASTCQTCPVGTFADTEGRHWCKFCYGRATSPTGSTSLADCKCPTGFIEEPSRPYNQPCMACTAGKFKSDWKTCSECETGMTSVPAADTCYGFCEAGKYMVVSGGVSDCITCRNNTYSEEGSSAVSD